MPDGSKIKIKPLYGSWYVGTYTEGKEVYYFEAKVLDRPSVFGISQGRVSKFSLYQLIKDEPVVWANYDITYSIKPLTAGLKEVVKEVLVILEQI